MCLWHSGIVSVSHTGDSEFEPSNLFKIIFFLSLNSANSVKTFRENSNKILQSLSSGIVSHMCIKETER